MKRSPQLRSLSSEHHGALVLALKARKASAGGDVSAFWEHLRERFAIELEPHFQAEERSLLPALERVGEDTLVARTLVARTLAEHREMRECLAGTADAANLMRFADLLERHVRFEERELFEVAQRRLSDEELAQICAPVPAGNVAAD